MAYVRVATNLFGFLVNTNVSSDGPRVSHTASRVVFSELERVYDLKIRLSD